MTWAVPWDLVGRLVVAALLGAVIGLERELDDHPAGLRTVMTVSVGAALFGLISTVGFEEFAGRDSAFQVEVTRVASNVVVGIGFLGAGLIFRRGESIQNLTTAASLWATAAVGLAAGVGNVGLAVVTTLLVAVVLVLVPVPKRWLVRRVGRDKRTVDLVPAETVSLPDLRARIDDLPGVHVYGWTVEKVDGRLRAACSLVAGPGSDIDERLAELASSDAVAELTVRT